MEDRNEQRPEPQVSPELENILNAWRREWPASVHLARIGDITGGVFSPKTISNHLARRTGPAGVARIGRKTVLNRDLFIEWVRENADRLPIEPARGQKCQRP